MKGSKYGTTKAARVMAAQDREKDLLAVLVAHLLESPLGDPVLQVEVCMMLGRLDRRSR